MLSYEDKKQIDEETVQFEKEAEKNQVQEKYISWLEEESIKVKEK